VWGGDITAGKAGSVATGSPATNPGAPVSWRWLIEPDDLPGDPAQGVPYSTSAVSIVPVGAPGAVIPTARSPGAVGLN
jgi:hypothetical protein